VNLTCGRNPWKQATKDDPTFSRYLADPGFLAEILPISPACHRLLKRIFCIDPRKRIGLRELRKEVKKVTKWTLTEGELRQYHDSFAIADEAANATSPASFLQPSPPAIVNETPPWDGVAATPSEVPFNFQLSVPDGGQPYYSYSASRKSHRPPTPSNPPQRRIRFANQPPPSFAREEVEGGQDEYWSLMDSDGHEHERRSAGTNRVRGDDGFEVEDPWLPESDTTSAPPVEREQSAAMEFYGFPTPPPTPRRRLFSGLSARMESAFSSDCSEMEAPRPQRSSKPTPVGPPAYKLPPTPESSPRRAPLPGMSPSPPLSVRSRSLTSRHWNDDQNTETTGYSATRSSRLPFPPLAPSNRLRHRLFGDQKSDPLSSNIPRSSPAFTASTLSSCGFQHPLSNSSRLSHSSTASSSRCSDSTSSCESALGPPTPSFAAFKLEPALAVNERRSRRSSSSGGEPGSGTPRAEVFESKRQPRNGRDEERNATAPATATTTTEPTDATDSPYYVTAAAY
jgi:hypothetical protein